MRRSLLVVAAVALGILGVVTAQRVLLPDGWNISPPAGNVAVIGTMPQGIALSPDGTKLAVVEAGYNPPALRILAASDLHVMQTISLKDAFGIPVWRGNSALLVAGASTNTVVSVNADSGAVTALRLSINWPVAIAVNDSGFSTANDGDNTLMILRECHVMGGGGTGPCTMGGPPGHIQTLPTGAHPGAVLYTRDGQLYVANRGEASLTHIVSNDTHTVAVDLHPSALALSNDGSKLYVACSDADTVDVVDTTTDEVVGRIDVGLALGRGASPNALAVAPDGTLYVSLGAENAIAEIRDDRVIARAPAGWYPTGVAVDANTVYVIDGKGESSRANPQFDPRHHHREGYVASALSGSVRAIARTSFGDASTAVVLANIPAPQATPAQTVLRPHGPIEHVIYIIKENRTYDQVLGDVAGADGDPKLTWFGYAVTPNQHAIVKRFGIFDNTYTDAQVSANGHNWSTAAFANDYLERFWPPNYGGRRKLYDFEDGSVASAPGTGYLWDDANAHHVSFRDYGEYVTYSVLGGHLVTTSMAGLKDKIDVHYPGFDLKYSDEDRVDEWQREFNAYVASGDLPSFEIVRLPNDHTAASARGMLTPESYVAQNDHAFGRIVDAVSHSPYWKSTAIFAIEDDAQNGPDHVDDQRTTFYLISPYAKAGVHHAHYSTSAVVRTMEILLGLPPMTIYDTVAPPLYDAFSVTPDLAPFDVQKLRIDDTFLNASNAYGAAASNRMDFSREDDVDPAVMNDILAHLAKAYRP
jgi:YVTN family beta-propeller protein